MALRREYQLHTKGITIAVPLAADDPPPAKQQVLDWLQDQIDRDGIEAGPASMYIELGQFDFEESSDEWEDEASEPTPSWMDGMAADVPGAR